MNLKTGLMILTAFTATTLASAQQTGQPQLQISQTNRTLSVSASDTVTVDPDLAILHVGFDTQLQDAKGAYAEGAQKSNAIIAAVKQAGIAESDIRSESQYLDRDPVKPHRFKLVQHWTVRVSPARAAEILDIAISNGATSSGDIEWTVKDEHTLADKALANAAERAKQNAETLAKGMGVRLGALVYTSNEMNAVVRPMPMFRTMALSAGATAPPPPLAVEPNKVTRDATVYAVFAIE